MKQSTPHVTCSMPNISWKFHDNPSTRFSVTDKQTEASKLLRTPISVKYCSFGWWLGAWSTPSHHPTQQCDIYISGYRYTLISEWTRLFGLLRIFDNLISGVVCYFCTTISVFCEIYTLRMRVVAHAAIVWVGGVLCRRPELGLSICPSRSHSAASCVAGNFGWTSWSSCTRKIQVEQMHTGATAGCSCQLGHQLQLCVQFE